MAILLSNYQIENKQNINEGKQKEKLNENNKDIDNIFKFNTTLSFEYIEDTERIEKTINYIILILGNIINKPPGFLDGVNISTFLIILGTLFYGIMSSDIQTTILILGTIGFIVGLYKSVSNIPITQTVSIKNPTLYSLKENKLKIYRFFVALQYIQLIEKIMNSTNLQKEILKNIIEEKNAIDDIPLIGKFLNIEYLNPNESLENLDIINFYTTQKDNNDSSIQKIPNTEENYRKFKEYKSELLSKNDLLKLNRLEEISIKMKSLKKEAKYIQH